MNVSKLTFFNSQFIVTNTFFLLFSSLAKKEEEKEYEKEKNGKVVKVKKEVDTIQHLQLFESNMTLTSDIPLQQSK